MRAVSRLLLLLLAGCRSADSSTQGLADAARPQRAERSDSELPPVANQWTPRSRIETGRCWLRAPLLDLAQIEATRREFLARNPGWRLDRDGVHPFTGLVEHAKDERVEATIAPAQALAGRTHEFRVLSFLRRNADLLGLRAPDLESLEWPGASWPDASAENIVVPLAIPCDEPAMKLLGKQQRCWNLDVGFARGGLVRQFSLEREGPPGDVCTTPVITAQQARAAPRIVQEAARRGMRLQPSDIGAARLTIRSFWSAEQWTWRLVWDVSLGDAFGPYVADAVSGESLELYRPIVR